MHNNTFIYDGDTVTHYVEGEYDSSRAQNDLFDDILDMLGFEILSSVDALSRMFEGNMSGNLAVKDYFAENRENLTLLINGEIKTTLTKNNATVLANSLGITLQKGIAFDEDGEAFKHLNDVWTPETTA